MWGAGCDGNIVEWSCNGERREEGRPAKVAIEVYVARCTDDNSARSKGCGVANNDLRADIIDRRQEIDGGARWARVKYTRTTDVRTR